ncbi:MAG: DUF4342 domain-containing protein [Actinomycetota bacterium]
MDERTTWEEFRVAGDQVVATVRRLVDDGNVRRIQLLNEDGEVLIEVPLTAGVAIGTIGVMAFPVVAAIGALAALVSRVTIRVELVGSTHDERTGV